MVIRVVTGPPAAGKTTYIAEHRQPGDVVIDHDALAVALGSPDSHDHPDAIARVAHAARGSAIKAAKTVGADVWLIHSQPNPAALADYEQQGAEVIVVDPGIEVVKERARTERPLDSQAAIDAWYSHASRNPAGDPTGNPPSDMETRMSDPNTGAPQSDPAATAAPADRGFPDATPIAEMTDAQRAAYWQFYARKHEDMVKAYGGLTPQQLGEMRTELDSLRSDKLSADEKALKAARDEAVSTVTAEYLPKLQAAEVKAIAADVLKGDQLTSFMSIMNPAAFVGENGQIDESKVMGALTGMFGAPQQNPAPAQRWQNAGQYAPPPPPGRPGEAGRAEAARRFGANKTTQ